MESKNLINPIIVCGVARSGTTFVRDLLNSHPAIAMADEFFLYKVPSVLSLFEEMQQAFNERISNAEWNRRKIEMMRLIWFSASREDRAAKNKTTCRFGCKTPGAEHYTEFYDKVFEQSPPCYIYLLREGRKVFLSRKNMDWGGEPDIRGQVKRYLHSITTMESFRSKSMERIYLLQVDQIGKTFEERLKKVEHLFDFLQEEVSDGVRTFVEQWTPTQTTVQKLGTGARPKFTELFPEEEAFLLNNEEYQEVMRRYGYSS
jgi:hypothetical protein